MANKKIIVEEFKRKKYAPSTLKDTMRFGKYSGEKVIDVIEDDPRYVDWLCRGGSDFSLDKEANEYLILWYDN